MSVRSKLLTSALVAVLLLGGGVAGYVALFSPPVSHSSEPEGGAYVAKQDESDDEDGEAKALTVRVVKPKLNKSQLVRSVTQPAYVQPYYKANLMARVAGVVKSVNKNIGDPIKAGEVLLELDVPDLVQDLAHKQAMVKLAVEEEKSAEANVDAVKAMAREARVLIDEKKADVDRALSKKRFHQSSYKRVKALVDQRAVEPALVDEKLRNVEAAEADHKSALAAVDTAAANADEFASRLRQAEVEVKVRRAKIDVAKAEVGKAQALLDCARVRAPFDGVVVSRKVDPGAFVQNASTGHPDPLLTVVRSDAVTLVMWVPERDAALVTDKTEATIRLDALGGQEMAAKVSRSSQWLDPDKSRDMRVEVDLDNKDGRLKAGMYGTMTLVLQRFDRALLLPASAVFVRDGQTYLCEEVDGLARFVKVRVQQEDGIRVKLVKVVPTSDGGETVQDLTGNERVVRSGQGEIRDGQELHGTLVEW